jgi:heterodisulfide reductase subunit C
VYNLKSSYLSLIVKYLQKQEGTPRPHSNIAGSCGLVGAGLCHVCLSSCYGSCGLSDRTSFLGIEIISHVCHSVESSVSPSLYLCFIGGENEHVCTRSFHVHHRTLVWWDGAFLRESQVDVSVFLPIAGSSLWVA